MVAFSYHLTIIQSLITQGQLSSLTPTGYEFVNLYFSNDANGEFSFKGHPPALQRTVKFHVENPNINNAVIANMCICVEQ